MSAPQLGCLSARARPTVELQLQKSTATSWRGLHVFTSTTWMSIVILTPPSPSVRSLRICSPWTSESQISTTNHPWKFHRGLHRGPSITSGVIMQAPASAKRSAALVSLVKGLWTWWSVLMTLLNWRPWMVGLGRSRLSQCNPVPTFCSRTYAFSRLRSFFRRATSACRR